MVKLADYGYRGVNLLYHKSDVLLYLNKIEESAKAMGAVNTLLFNGSEWRDLIQTGTDWKALKEDLSVSIKTENLVSRSWGAARTCWLCLAGSKSIWMSSSHRKDLRNSLNLWSTFDGNVNRFTFNGYDSLFKFPIQLLLMPLL